MKKLLALLLLAVPCFASGPKYIGPSSDPLLYQEFTEAYHQIGNPVFNVASGSSETLKYLNVSSITLNGVNLTAATPGQVQGTATNDSAAAGKVGEVISCSLAGGSATSLTTNVAKTICSMSLTPGQWSIVGHGGFITGTGTVISYSVFSISLTNNASASGLLNLAPSAAGEVMFENDVPNNALTGAVVIEYPLTAVAKVASTATYYWVTQAGFTVSTLTAFGTMTATRTR